MSDEAWFPEPFGPVYERPPGAPCPDCECCTLRLCHIAAGKDTPARTSPRPANCRWLPVLGDGRARARTRTMQEADEPGPERVPRVAAVTGPDPDMIRLAAAGLAATAGQAPGIVKVRLSGAAADVELLATLLADYAGSGLDVLERSAPYPNRRDPGVRVYLTLQITGGAP